MAANDDARLDTNADPEGQGLPPEVFDAIMQRANELPDAQPQASQPQAVDGERPQPSLLHRLATGLAVPGLEAIGAATESAVLGAAKAGIETKDFVAGEPKEAEKSGARRWIEGESKKLRGESAVNGVAESIAQFGVGFIGLGKISKAVGVASRIGPWAEGVAHRH